MSQRQKQMTMAFLYELMSHREGDIRRQAADLLGNMIAHYDISYGKELPKNVDIILDETNGFLLWQKYLDMILLPDHKMIDKHKRWLGYGLKRVVTSLLENCKVKTNANILCICFHTIRKIVMQKRRLCWQTPFHLCQWIFCKKKKSNKYYCFYKAFCK